MSYADAPVNISNQDILTVVEKPGCIWKPSPLAAFPGISRVAGQGGFSAVVASFSSTPQINQIEEVLAP